MTPFLILTVVLLAVGATVARRRLAPEALADCLNWWVLYIALPALVLEVLPSLHLDRHLWFLFTSQWLVFVGSFALFQVLGRGFGWPRQRVAALTLVCGLSNTSFIGFPLLEVLRGIDSVALGAIADQLGAFMMLAIGGALVVAWGSGDAERPRDIVLRVVRFPAFIALIVGLIAGQYGGWPESLSPVLHRLGQTVTPLALLSAGLRLQLHFSAGHRAAALLGLSWKLLIAPLLIWGLGIAAGVHGDTLAVGVLETAMAPMFTGALLARQHRLEPELVDSMLSVGLLASFITVPLWNLLL